MEVWTTEHEEGKIGTIDGCSLDFSPTSDEETQKLLVPEGEEDQAWTEEEYGERLRTS